MRTDLEPQRRRSERGKLHGRRGRRPADDRDDQGDRFGVRVLRRSGPGYQAKLDRRAADARAARAAASIAASVLSRVNALLVLGVGALRVMDGHMSVGTLVAFQSLMASFIAPIETAGAGRRRRLQQLRGNVERLDDVLEHERDPSVGAEAERGRPDEPQPHADRRARAQATSRFGYLPFSPPLVDELDLHIAPGQRVALVGGTGSGKSTVAKLVSGLYRPWSGEILFDGGPRETLPRESLTASVAMVDQDITLFEGTVRENLTLWDDTMPEADMVQAAKDACIHEDIAKLPGRLRRQASPRAASTSAAASASGSRSRARSCGSRRWSCSTRRPARSIRRPSARVDENLRRRGCSCLIVAHRLSTIRDCDEIIVLERGRVVQRGSHEQLLAARRRYRELITAARTAMNESFRKHRVVEAAPGRPRASEVPVAGRPAALARRPVVRVRDAVRASPAVLRRLSRGRADRPARAPGDLCAPGQLLFGLEPAPGAGATALLLSGVSGSVVWRMPTALLFRLGGDEAGAVIVGRCSTRGFGF